MQSNKGRMQWCLEQKRGIKLDALNSTLAKAYLKKAQGSLNMLNAAIERKVVLG